MKHKADIDQAVENFSRQKAVRGDDVHFDINHHPNLYLLAVERTGWRRWLFGRWVYSSEPFRRDIQRKCENAQFGRALRPWERLWPAADASEPNHD